MLNSILNYLSFPRYKGHNPWLDALRAMAVLFVLVRHGVRVQPGPELPGWLSNIAHNGWMGVDLFFVLSGFLIARILLRRMEKGAAPFSWRYFEDRILRIVPAYYAVLLLCVIGFFPGHLSDVTNLGSRIVYHLVFLHDYLGSNINVVFWSLGVEEKFYILVPLLMLVLLKARSFKTQLFICLLVLLISPVSRGFGFQNVEGGMVYQDFFDQLRSPFHMSLEGFAIGIIIALIQFRGWLLSERAAKYCLIAAFTALLLWTASHNFLESINLFDATLQPLLLVLLFGAMVYSGICLANVSMPGEPVMRFIARLSYSLYLIHFPLIPVIVTYSVDKGPAIFWLVYFAVTFMAAIILHFFVEKPFLLLKKNRAAQVKKPAGFVPVEPT